MGVIPLYLHDELLAKTIAFERGTLIISMYEKLAGHHVNIGIPIAMICKDM